MRRCKVPANTMFQPVTTVTVEWFDEITGQWADLGEAATTGKALTRVYGLKAADTTPQRYRIVSTTARTFTLDESFAVLLAQPILITALDPDSSPVAGSLSSASVISPVEETRLDGVTC